jgi:hypothetical protein
MATPYAGSRPRTLKTMDQKPSICLLSTKAVDVLVHDYRGVEHCPTRLPDDDSLGGGRRGPALKGTAGETSKKGTRRAMTTRSI